MAGGARCVWPVMSPGQLWPSTVRALELFNVWELWSRAGGRQWISSPAGIISSSARLVGICGSTEQGGSCFCVLLSKGPRLPTYRHTCLINNHARTDQYGHRTLSGRVILAMADWNLCRRPRSAPKMHNRPAPRLRANVAATSRSRRRSLSSLLHSKVPLRLTGMHATL